MGRIVGGRVRVRKLVITLTAITGILAMVALAGCGDGGDTAAPAEQWAFDEGEAVQPEDMIGEDAGPEPTDGEEAGEEVGLAGPEGAEATEEVFEDLDPCTLVTVEEWANRQDIAAAEADQVSLENGDACGYLTGEDTLRLALAVFTTAGGSWLSADVGDAVTLEVAGHPARWVGAYPLDQSSVLVVDLGTSELVIEMSTRTGTDDVTLRDAAVHFAGLAIPRIPA